MEIPQCEKLKDLYEDCSKDLKKQFWKDYNVKDFFACDHLFQDFKDCYDVGMDERVREIKKAKAAKAKEGVSSS